MVSSQGSRAVDGERAASADPIVGVVLVDPLPVVRAGIAMLIDDRSDMEVLAEAGTAEEGLELVAGLRRTRLVALVGLGLEGDRDAFWLIRELRDRYPSVAILAAGARSDAIAISRALFVGADGAYLTAVGWKPPKAKASEQLTATREAILAALEASATGEIPARGPRGGVRWTARYFVRRVAWHVIAHVWEIERRAALQGPR